MRRRAAKTDRNQKPIVAALRAAGWVVRPLHMVGDGWPDLAVAKHGLNVLVECKMPKEKLTPDEAEFWETWPGPKVIVYDEQDAVDKLGAML